MALKHLGDGTVTKAAADAKPAASAYASGTLLKNTDDYKRWVNSGAEWLLQETDRYNKYTVLLEGSQWQVTDQNKKLQSSSTVDVQAAIQPILDAQANNTTLHFVFDAYMMTINNPINLPHGIANDNQDVVFEGKKSFTRRVSAAGTAPQFHASTTFPTGRALIEGISTNGSGEVVKFKCENLGFANVNFATRDVSGIKIDTDDNVDRSIVIRDIWTQYMKVGIHLLGKVWVGLFQDIIISNGNASMEATASILLEAGSHSSSGNPTPKGNTFQNLWINEIGWVENFIKIKNGNYNTFFNTFIDSFRCRFAGVSIEQNTDSALIASDNKFFDLRILDVGQVPAPDTRIAGIELKGQYVVNNQFFSCGVNRIGVNHVRISDGAARNFVQHTGFWGSALKVDDTGAGIGNTVEVVAGFTLPVDTPADSKITHTGGLSKIIDKRPGAEKRGIATGRTDGSTIAHGLFAAPAWYFVIGSVPGEIVNATADATNLTLSIKTGAGAAGTSQSISWGAGCYT